MHKPRLNTWTSWQWQWTRRKWIDSYITFFCLLLRRWSTGVIMYTLLAGSPPFWHRKQMLMLRMILAGKYEFSSLEWDDRSDTVKDLVCVACFNSLWSRLSWWQPVLKELVQNCLEKKSQLVFFPVDFQIISCGPATSLYSYRSPQSPLLPTVQGRRSSAFQPLQEVQGKEQMF